MSVDRPIVGYLQPEATFTHLAAISQFGREATFEPMETDDICHAIQRSGDRLRRASH